MVAPRWMLLALMVVVGPLLWLAGVAGTEAASIAVAPPDAADARYFISNYAGPGRAITGFFALINLVLLWVLMPTARQLAATHLGTYTRAVVTSGLAASLAWFEHRFNPVETNWGGDPDAWSMVEDHVATSYHGIGNVWIALVLATTATIAGQAIAAAVATVRERRSGLRTAAAPELDGEDGRGGQERP